MNMSYIVVVVVGVVVVAMSKEEQERLDAVSYMTQEQDLAKLCPVLIIQVQPPKTTPRTNKQRREKEPIHI